MKVSNDNLFGPCVVVVVVVVVVVLTRENRRRDCPSRCMRAPNYGGRVPVDTTTGPAPVCRAPKNPPINPSPPRRAARTTGSQRFLNSSSCEISAVSFTMVPGIQLNLHNRDMSHRVQQLGKAYGPTDRLDHRKQPLRRDGNEPAEPAQQGRRSPRSRTANVESPWSSEQQDHGNLPLHHDGNVDDLEELQLRNFRSFLQCEP